MIIKENINLKEYSNMRVGGIGKKVIYVENKEELEKVSIEEKNIFLIGNGTNVLFDDGLIDITLLSLKNLKNIEIIEKNNEYAKVYVESGVDFKDVIKFLEENNLSGIENMTGIPGSMGGIVNMNAGAYQTEIFDVIDSVEILDDSKKIRRYKKEELSYNYRTTDIKKNGWIIVSCVLKLTYGFNKEASYDKLEKRKNNHPLDLPNLGSTFKNPKGEFAAQIISDLGLKGYRVGNACISPKHPNFITNLGNATFDDVMGVITYVKQVVKEQRGIELETEIIIKKK